MHDKTSKLLLVTGANGGLGQATIRHLINDGYRRFILACRTKERAVQAMENLTLETNPANIQLIPVGGFDMKDPDAIKEAVSAISDYEVDIVFLQAGGVIFDRDYQVTPYKDLSIESTVFQNVVGAHVTLMHLLEAGIIKDKARVIYAGGEGARGIPGMMAKPHFSTTDELLQYLAGLGLGKKYNPMNAIAVSKLLGGLWVQEIAERYQGKFDVIWFSPGLTAGTGGMAGAGKFKEEFFQGFVFKLLMFFGIAQSADAGGRKFADCINGEYGKNGDILGAPEGKTLGTIVDQKPMNKVFAREDLRNTFWQILEIVVPFKTD